MSQTAADQAIAKMEANIKEITGRTVADWVTLVGRTEHEKHGQIVKFLKSEHGITHGYANLIAHRALEADSGVPSDSDLVEAQYAGPKADLRVIYDQVIKAVGEFGDDLEIAPKKSYVSLRRKKQFALIQPSTKTRVDLGINLKGKAAEEKLEISGSFNAMVSHRVRLSSAADVDTAVIAWLKQAFEAAG